MPLPSDFDQSSWRYLRDGLDRNILKAETNYIEYHGLAASDIAEGYREVRRLQSGVEPDYTSPAVVAGYGFQYLAKRASCIAGALTKIADRGVPSRVLDIGSGSGATALALSLLVPRNTIQIVSVEPSSEMRLFAQMLTLSGAHQNIQRAGSWNDIREENLRLPELAFDLVVMSACLPYEAEFSWSTRAWTSVGSAVGRRTRPPSSVIAIQPQAKIGLLESLQTGLDSTGYYETEIGCCHHLPRVILRPLKLHDCTSLLKTYHPSAFDVDTWNPNRNEAILIGTEEGEPDADGWE